MAPPAYTGADWRLCVFTFGASLAAGFFATPLLSALESELGLDTLEMGSDAYPPG